MWVRNLVHISVLTLEKVIHYWSGSEGINNAAWICPILVALAVIQIFGIKGYGEVRRPK